MVRSTYTNQPTPPVIPQLTLDLHPRYTGADAPSGSLMIHQPTSCIGANHMSNTVLSSASNATINVFDTVANTANAVTKLVNGVSTGANMFERMMNDMDLDHADRSKLHRKNYRNELLENSARVAAKRQAEMQREMQDDPHFAKLFADNYSDLKSVFEEPQV